MNEIFWLRNATFGKLHICIGRNDDILKRIEKGIQKERSWRLDRVPGHTFFSVRFNSRFIDIDWM